MHFVLIILFFHKKYSFLNNLKKMSLYLGIRIQNNYKYSRCNSPAVRTGHCSHICLVCTGQVWNRSLCLYTAAHRRIYSR